MREIKLYRVRYADKNCPVKDREYQIDRKGPVGTIAEFEEAFPRDLITVVEE